MLDGEQYFSAFPDERPHRQPLLASPELVDALSALQREFQQFLAGAGTRAHEAAGRTADDAT